MESNDWQRILSVGPWTEMAKIQSSEPPDMNTLAESWRLRIEAAVKAERDRCIKIAEDQGANGHLQSMVSEEYHDGATDCANVIAIRIREGK